MARDPATRKASREAQNARRKAQRDLANVVNEIAGSKIVNWKTVNEYLEKNKEISSNREVAALLKQKQNVTSQNARGKKASYTESQVKKVRENLDAYSDMRFKEKKKVKEGGIQNLAQLERRNEITKRNLNQAANGLSVYEKMDVKRFYAVTQPLWSSAPSNREYNAYIMKRFGIPDLETVYNLVMNKKLDYRDFNFQSEEAFNDFVESLKDRGIDLKKMREIIANSYPKDDDTTDNLPEIDEKEQEGSPTFLMAITIDAARLFM